MMDSARTALRPPGAQQSAILPGQGHNRAATGHQKFTWLAAEGCSSHLQFGRFLTSLTSWLLRTHPPLPLRLASFPRPCLSPSHPCTPSRFWRLTSGLTNLVPCRFAEVIEIRGANCVIGNRSVGPRAILKRRQSQWRRVKLALNQLGNNIIPGECCNVLAAKLLTSQGSC